MSRDPATAPSSSSSLAGSGSATPDSASAPTGTKSPGKTAIAIQAAPATRQPSIPRAEPSLPRFAKDAGSINPEIFQKNACNNRKRRKTGVPDPASRQPGDASQNDIRLTLMSSLSGVSPTGGDQMTRWFPVAVDCRPSPHRRPSRRSAAGVKSRDFSLRSHVHIGNSLSSPKAR